MKKKIKKLISCVLVMAMIFTLLPSSAFADENDKNSYATATDADIDDEEIIDEDMIAPLATTYTIKDYTAPVLSDTDTRTFYLDSMSAAKWVKVGYNYIQTGGSYDQTVHLFTSKVTLQDGTQEERSAFCIEPGRPFEDTRIGKSYSANKIIDSKFTKLMFYCYGCPGYNENESLRTAFHNKAKTILSKVTLSGFTKDYFYDYVLSHYLLGYYVEEVYGFAYINQHHTTGTNNKPWFTGLTNEYLDDPTVKDLVAEYANEIISTYPAPSSRFNAYLLQTGYSSRQIMGLIVINNRTIIPMNDSFPKDTKLYAIMSTKPDEETAFIKTGNK